MLVGDERLELVHAVGKEQERQVEGLVRLVLGVVRVILAEGVEAREELVSGHVGSRPAAGCQDFISRYPSFISARRANRPASSGLCVTTTSIAPSCRYRS